MAFSVISADHGCGDLITDVNIFFEIKSRIACEIFQTDDTFGVVFQIQCDLRFGNTDYGSGEDIAFMDLFKRSFQFFSVISHGFCRFFRCGSFGGFRCFSSRSFGFCCEFFRCF